METEQEVKPIPPHKSNTHEEHYAHFHESPRATMRWRGGTVFARKEDNGNWWASVALCVTGDVFCKKTGRIIARRRYMLARDANNNDYRYQLHPKKPYPSYEEMREAYVAFQNDEIERNGQ